MNYDIEQIDATQLVARIVEATGLSATKIALAAGIAPSTLTRIYPKPSVDYTLSTRTIAKLKAAFTDILSSDFDGTNRLNILRSPRHSHAGGYNSGNEAIAVFVPNIAIHRDVAGEISWPELELYDSDMMAVQDQLMLPLDPSRYFAIYIQGDAMAPRFRAGERIIVDRVKPVKIDSSVLVRLKVSEHKHYLCLAHLTQRDRNLVTLAQYRDNVPVSIHRSAIMQMQPVVSVLTDEF